MLFVNQKCTISFFSNDEDSIAHFSSLVLEIAEQCIPKTSTNLKHNRPWYDDDCKKAIRERKAALRRFNVFPTTDNHNHFKIFRAKARRTVRQSKKKSWQNYVSKLNSRTSIKKVWEMVKKISGKRSSTALNHLH